MRLLAASLSALLLAAVPLHAQAAPPPPVANPPMQAEPIPVEQFFERPQTSGAVLSPDGRHVALRRLSSQGRMMLAVFDIASRKSHAVANFRNADVNQFYWLSNDRLGFNTVNIDHDGAVGKTAVYAIDLDGQNRIMLHETVDRARGFADGDRVGVNFHTEYGYGGFFTTPSEEMYVIVDYPDLTELARMSTRTGRIHNFRLPNNTLHVLIDADGQPRVASALRNQQQLSFLRDADSWREIASADSRHNDGFKPLLYAEGQLYVRARNGRDEAGVYRYDLTEKKLLEPALITAPGFDTDGQFITGARNMLGYRFNTDAETTVWFDPAMKALQEQVDQQFPGLVNQIARARQGETPYVLIDTHSDIQSHAYLLYNSETRAVQLLGSVHPDLPTERMASMSMERIPARDGRLIPAFITLPKNAQPPYPTVVLNASNIKQRNGLWEWNPEVQFLASRGYAVLQVSPRGSNGFGAQHQRGQPAGQTPDAITDLADVVQWAVRKGHTDAARVCIAGAGSGGYAALQSLQAQPQTYRCGISWSALVSPSGADGSAALSELRQPVLLAYDKDSARLDYQQGRKLYEALQARQAPVQWLDYTTTVEDWKTQRPRIELWRQIEAFLAKQIGQQIEQRRP